MVSLDDQIPDAPPALTSVLMLDQGLEALEAISPQRRQVVELRYFAGMEFSEIAGVLEVSERTIYREWERARAFLPAMLDEEGGEVRNSVVKGKCVRGRVDFCGCCFIRKYTQQIYIKKIL